MTPADKAKLDFKLWAATTDVSELMDKFEHMDEDDLQMFAEGLLELQAQLQRIEFDDG